MVTPKNTPFALRKTDWSKRTKPDLNHPWNFYFYRIESATHNLNPANPIGIFDSGIGGLTVARAVNKLLPNEKLIYFGDTAHLPYGDKSQKAIRSYATKISTFLLDQGCKMIIIACNTASASAFTTVKKQTAEKALVLNVIDPVVTHVAQKHSEGKVGVIGTKGTINSRVYVRKLSNTANGIKVVSKATPLLAPMIEEGFYNNYISRTILHSYLSNKHLANIEALVLACTHYPLIKKEVKEFYGPAVDIVDSAKVVAKSVKKELENRGLLNPSKRKPGHRFFVSDYTQSFEESTKIFFQDAIQLKKAKIWED